MGTRCPPSVLHPLRPTSSSHPPPYLEFLLLVPPTHIPDLPPLSLDTRFSFSLHPTALPKGQGVLAQLHSL